jgi:hypothetical protein
MVKPYTQEILEKSVIVRTFSSDVEEKDLQWHWDEEDRLIEAMEKTDWKFQFDNELPISFSESIFIERGRIHRIIKGSEDLRLKITFL